MARAHLTSKQPRPRGSQSEPPGADSLVLPDGPRLLNADRFDNSINVPSHSHTGAELVLVTFGRCAIELPGQRFEGAPGTLFVLPARVPQVQLAYESTRTTFAIFLPGSFSFDETARTLNVTASPEIGRWMEDLCTLFRATDADNRPVVHGLLLAILERIKQLERQNRTLTTLHPGLTRALAFLREHLAEELSLNEVARASGVSPSHLRMLFRAQFGCGPMQYLQQMRLDLARKLLPHPYLRIREVARECGYPDAKYFTRLFRRSTGKSPRQWTREKV